MEYALQKALDYIEAHLKEKTDYDAIARAAYCSRYNFMRVFSVLSGYSLGEYIRLRRLTLAGQALARGGKVIEVAYDFCYDSPESFERAFKAFHGVTPTEAKQGAPLRLVSKLTLKLSIEGGSDMQCKIEEKKNLSFLAVGGGTRQTEEEKSLLKQLEGGEYYEIRVVKRKSGVERFHYFAVDDSRLNELFGMEWLVSFLQKIKERKYFTFSIPAEALRKGVHNFDYRHLKDGTYAVFVKERENKEGEAEELRRYALSEFILPNGYELAGGDEIFKIGEKTVEFWLPVKPL